jgi:hypothetical protein
VFASTWRFLCDQNVPEPLTKFFEAQSQDVIRSKDVVGEAAKDPVVARFAIEEKRILVSWDRDFGQQRFMAPRYQGLSRIGFSCPEPLAVERFEQVADVVDFLIRRHNGLPPEIRIAKEKVAHRDILIRG